MYMATNGNEIPRKTRPEFRCEKCNYSTVRKNDYDRHVLTAKHMMATDVNATSLTEFRCEKCTYATVRKNDYDKHILTAKHKMATTRTTKSQPVYVCDNCNKQYNDRTGLWKHTKKKCLSNQIIPSKDELIITLVKQNVEQSKQAVEQSKKAAEKAEEQSKQVAELHEKIIELCKNGVANTTINSNNNSHNKSFNLNFFLNETCKDAMNLTDFAKSVVLQLSDIDAIGEVGYVNGMTNIIASHLNSLAENKRPIHCTDVKREVVYVKDEDKWRKDVNKEKMRLLIKKMDKKLAPLMATYSNNYNKVYHSDSELIQHSQLRYEIYGGKNEESVNEDDIIRNISKNTTIDRLTK